MSHEHGYDEWQISDDDLLAIDYYMPMILSNLLKNHFSSAAVNRIPALRNLVYAPTINQGAARNTPESLYIHRWDELNYTATNATPAIIIKDNDSASHRLGIGDKHMAPGPVPNSSTFSRAWASSCTIFCITPVPGLAKLLAWEVASHIEEAAPELNTMLRLHKMEVSAIGAAKPIKEFEKNFAVPINVEYIFVRSWTLTPAEPLLQNVQQSFETRL